MDVNTLVNPDKERGSSPEVGGLWGKPQMLQKDALSSPCGI